MTLNNVSREEKNAENAIKSHFAAVCHSKITVDEIMEASESYCMGAVEQCGCHVNRRRATMEHHPDHSTNTISFSSDSAAAVAFEASYETLRNKFKLYTVQTLSKVHTVL